MSAQTGPEVAPSGLVADAVASCGALPETLRTALATSKAMEQVAEEWLEISIEDAERMIPALIRTLEILTHGTDCIDFDKQEEDWEKFIDAFLHPSEKVERAIALIRQAADLLQSEKPLKLSDTGAITGSKNGGLQVNMKALEANNRENKKTSHDYVFTLRNMVTMLASSTVLSNDVPSCPRLIDPEHIGTRGRAADLQSAFNGAAVREIFCRLPENLRDNYALIAKLAEYAGVVLSRQNVRGIILRGRT